VRYFCPGSVFYTWTVCIIDFTTVTRDITCRRYEKGSEKFIAYSDKFKLREHVLFVRNLRKRHEQLHQNIVKVMTQEENALVRVISIQLRKHMRFKDIN